MTSLPSCLRANGGVLELDVLVQPRASRSRPAGFHDDRLKVQLSAPPVDGEANAALVELVARLFGAARRDVAILRGETGRRKTLRIAEVPLAHALDALAAVAP
jgi:uncharacterized protein (TIGR00251 family)